MYTESIKYDLGSGAEAFSARREGHPVRKDHQRDQDKQIICQEYNALRITDFEGRAALLDKLLPHKGSGLTIVPPFFCDYGSNLEFGDNVFINGYCVFLDEARITIGSGSVIAGGSVVVKDIPPGILAAGNPCRVIRPLSPDDRDRYVR